MLARHGTIDDATSQVMASVMGFRNIAVADYATLDHEIVEGIVRSHLGDLEAFSGVVVSYLPR